MFFRVLVVTLLSVPCLADTTVAVFKPISGVCTGNLKITHSVDSSGEYFCFQGPYIRPYSERTDDGITNRIKVGTVKAASKFIALTDTTETGPNFIRFHNHWVAGAAFGDNFYNYAFSGDKLQSTIWSANTSQQVCVYQKIQ